MMTEPLPQAFPMNRVPILLALVLGGTALVALDRWSTRPPSVAISQTATTVPPSATMVLPPKTITRGAEIFGINEAVSVPRPWIERGLLTPEQEPAALAEDAKNAKNLGATLVRGTTQVYPYLDQQSLERAHWDWTRSDAWVQAVQGAGLEPLLMVGPWPGTQTATYTSHYLPSDMAAYSAYVGRVVERYDGDGVDDMPGLARGVRYWEIDNEPDLHNSRPPKGNRSQDPVNFETPEEFAQVMIASAAAIRAASPTAKILSGGFFYIRTPAGRSYAEKLAALPGVMAAMDILSVHCYFQEESLDAVTQTLQEAITLFPGKAIWVTETSVPSGALDEAAQARLVAGIYGAFLAGGAERIFWHTLADPPMPPNQQRRPPMSTQSLLRMVNADAGPGGVAEDKPSGALYRRLAAKLATTDPRQYREELVDGGRLLWTGAGWLAFWGTPTLPVGAGEVTDLMTGETRAPGKEVQAPAYISTKK